MNFSIITDNIITSKLRFHEIFHEHCNICILTNSYKRQTSHSSRIAEYQKNLIQITVFITDLHQPYLIKNIM